MRLYAASKVPAALYMANRTSGSWFAVWAMRVMTFRRPKRVIGASASAARCTSSMSGRVRPASVTATSTSGCSTTVVDDQDLGFPHRCEFVQVPSLPATLLRVSPLAP